jgi:hypothetical protein
MICMDCGAETELYFHGRPLCVNCTEKQTATIIGNQEAESSEAESPSEPKPTRRWSDPTLLIRPI